MTRRYNTIPLKPRRRLLRHDSTPTEIILWNELRNRKLGHRFVRQYSVEGYVLDFYCPKAKLGIEVEGKIHDRTKIYDTYRERYLCEFNINIMKFKNEEVLNDIGKVLNTISLSLPKRGIKG
ncbi:MAG: DUF559 domain-containing protein [Patescibacteria group bacterium]